MNENYWIYSKLKPHNAPVDTQNAVLTTLLEFFCQGSEKISLKWHRGKILPKMQLGFLQNYRLQFLRQCLDQQFLKSENGHSKPIFWIMGPALKLFGPKQQEVERRFLLFKNPNVLLFKTTGCISLIKFPIVNFLTEENHLAKICEVKLLGWEKWWTEIAKNCKSGQYYQNFCICSLCLIVQTRLRSEQSSAFHPSRAESKIVFSKKLI